MTNSPSEKWSLIGCELLRLGHLNEAENAFNQSLASYDRCILALAGKQKIAVLRGINDNVIQEQIDKIIQVDSRPSMGSHNPLGLFFPELLQKYYPKLTLAEYLERRIPSVNSLIDYFARNDGPNILKGYEEREIQEAYVIRYYSHYIEPIYQELNQIPITPWVNQEDRDFSVCYYGCGPAPEYLGTIRFISERLPRIRFINSYFFDKNPWDWAREITIDCCSKNYMVRPDIIAKQWNYSVDLTTFSDKNKLLPFQAITVARLHIFQNCLRDLQMECKDDNKVIEVMINIFHSIPKGSAMVVIDLMYNRTRDILMDFATKVKEERDGIVFRCKIDNPERVQSNLIKSPELRTFEGEIGKERLRTNYYSLAILRI